MSHVDQKQFLSITVLAVDPQLPPTNDRMAVEETNIEGDEDLGCYIYLIPSLFEQLDCQQRQDNR